jgi:IS5 family transposase
MSANNMGYDVAYNMQTAVDAKNHLIVAADVTNNPADQGQLYPMAEQAKQELDTTEITVLADKGYYSGECLKKCEENEITAIVAKQNPPSTTGNPAYTLDKFKYDKANDWYLCPHGEKLCNVSEDTAKDKLYRSKACKTCRHKNECTKNKRGRQIIHGPYHEVMERADECLVQNMTLYKQRKMIVEHPFGTLKRTLGYTHFLLRGIEKVKGEAVMHCLMYNLKRALNLLGTTKLAEAIRKRAALPYRRVAALFMSKPFRAHLSALSTEHSRDFRTV